MNDDAAAQAAVWPEGELFLWEFYALSLQNVWETTGSSADRDVMIRESRRALLKMDDVLPHPPFSKMRHWELRGGICWFAGQNLVRARLVAAQGASAEEVSRFHEDSEVLFRAFAQSQSGVLEGHPGMSWPVDSLFGLQSLLIHDQQFGTHYFAPSYAKWKRTVVAGADRTTQLAPSFTYLDGRPRDVPRGCALSWSLAVLPALDEAYAAEQWASYRQHFASCAAGLCLFREYPVGHHRGADADSGPMVAGYGMSATAFALAAARANGDVETAAALQRLGELGGLPLWTFSGKRYWFGAVPLFDVFSLWVTTVPLGKDAKTPSPVAAPVVFVALLWLGALWLGFRWLKRALSATANQTGAAPEALHPASRPG
ncbi:MAG: hypothetical protein ACJ790_07435 [Myxococcaceae bacterium]